MTPADLDRFHKDLAAALIAGVPLEIGAGDSRPALLTAAGVDQRRIELEAELSGQSAEMAADDQYLGLSQKFVDGHRRYVAALRAFEGIGSMVPVLDGLSVGVTSSRQTNQALRWTWFHLGLLILIAYFGLWLFSTSVEPLIADMRADAHLLASANRLTRDDVLSSWPTFLPGIGCGLALLFAWAMWGGTRKLTSWFGGARYVQLRLTMSAVNTMRLLLAANMPLDEALAISCDLVGIDVKSRRNVQSLASTGMVDAAAKTEHLSLMASRSLLDLKYRTALVAILVVGGLVCAVYGVLIFRPIAAMLNEIGEVAI